MVSLRPGQTLRTETITATLQAVRDLQGPADKNHGAKWDAILARMVKPGPDGPAMEEIEEALNVLMDRGQIFEPTLGILKAV